MIERVDLYKAACDRCKTRFYTIAERDALIEKMRDKQWLIEDRSCMCPECFKKRGGVI